MAALPQLKGPPAVWASFVAQARWKNWVLLAQLLLIAFLLLLVSYLVDRKPDVVVVTQTGESTYVPASLANRALLDFLRQQRGVASELTILAFTKRFVQLTTAINSSTIDESWPQALQMMIDPLAQKLDEEAKAAKLLETYRLAQVRTTLAFREVELTERRGDKALLRAKVLRHREGLLAGRDSTDDGLQMDLVLLDVPRTARHPDGLAVFAWKSAPLAGADAGVSPSESLPH